MQLSWLIPTIPFLGFLLNGFFGAKLGRRAVGVLGCSTVGASFALGVYYFLQVLKLDPHHRVIHETFYTWLQAGSLKVSAAFLVDPLSLVMVLVVTGVGFLIHVYSTGYMHDDPGYARYFAYLNLFVAAMLILVLADSLPVMFVGWEGVGLCSYLLIGFWYDKPSAADAGKKAFIVNRVGDFGFLLAIFMIFWTLGTLSFTGIAQEAPTFFRPGDATAVVITLLLFLGATGKSAQIPLYVWLPDAMEGPTPVSALIHAATMVTAGVYMIARLSVLYALAPFSLGVVAFVGCATAVFAATIGLVQNDIKRVLAYSTVSQLGYMFLGCGVGAFVAGIFHLMTHAFFKALLFLCSGSVIHALHGEQDIRKMGGLRKYMPITYITFLFGTLAISGIVPFAGFFSKDEILWETFANGFPILYLLALFGAAMTAFYMFRLLYLTFHGTSRMDPDVEAHAHESPRNMTIPLSVLAVLSLVGGWIQLPFLKDGKLFGDFLHPVFARAEAILHGHAEVHAHHFMEGALMAASLAIVAGGIYLAWRFYIRQPEQPAKLAAEYPGAYRLLLEKYRVDELYLRLVVNPLLALADLLHRFVDVGFIDGAVNGAGRFFKGLSQKIRPLQTGLVHNYALSILIGVVAVMGYIVFRG